MTVFLRGGDGCAFPTDSRCRADGQRTAPPPILQKTPRRRMHTRTAHVYAQGHTRRHTSEAIGLKGLTSGRSVSAVEKSNTPLRPHEWAGVGRRGAARDHCRRSSRYEPPDLVQRGIAPWCEPRRSVLHARIRSRESHEASL